MFVSMEKGDLLKIKVLKFLVERKRDAYPNPVKFYRKTLHKHTGIKLGYLDILIKEMAEKDHSIEWAYDIFEGWKVWASDVSEHLLESQYYLNVRDVVSAPGIKEEREVSISKKIRDEIFELTLRHIVEAIVFAILCLAGYKSCNRYTPQKDKLTGEVSISNISYHKI